MTPPRLPPELTVHLDTYGRTLEMCLKRISNFGATTYVNICADTQVVVPWGSVDWALAAGLISLGGIVLGTLLVLLAGFIFMVREGP